MGKRIEFNLEDMTRMYLYAKTPIMMLIIIV